MHDIHISLKGKLSSMVKNKKIPHIIFHGPIGSGKRTILEYFIKSIYDNNIDHIKQYVMYINCAHGKGIRFIRDQLKFFAKTNIQNKKGYFFKSIVLFNADKLTTDAQSALRRCIEQFSHTTRFFIIVENKNKLLKPILSRFCNIHVPSPIINGKKQNLHQKRLIIKNHIQKKRIEWLKKQLSQKKNFVTLQKCRDLALKLYEKGYNILDLCFIIENFITLPNKYLNLVYFDRIRSEYRNEKLLLFEILYFIFMRHELHLENIEIV